MSRTPIPPDPSRPWQSYASTYRAREMRTLAAWIAAGASGSVVGLSGVGKTNLLNVLCHRPDLLQRYLPDPTSPVVLVPVDLNNLSAATLSAFYRIILRAFYEIRGRFEPAAQCLVAQQYMENRAALDPFLSLSALRELLLYFQAEGVQIVLVLDRFDVFCRVATPEIGDTLRGLRDSFQDTVSYIVGMRQTPAYTDGLATLGEVYRLLAAHLLYVGPLTADDARVLIQRRMAGMGRTPGEEEIQQMLALTGGYPTLLKAVCRWWLLTADRPPYKQWLSILSIDLGIQARLRDLWLGLTQEEQKTLAELTQINNQHLAQHEWYERQAPVLKLLAAKGVCVPGNDSWALFGTLFAAYVVQEGALSRGRISMDAQTQLFYQGTELIDELTPKERALLHFLLTYPQERHTYTDLILHVWTEDERPHGVSNESLHQIVRGLRQKTEPNPSQPIYLVNWRGKPEGGYQFFPEGRPR